MNVKNRNKKLVVYYNISCYPGSVDVNFFPGTFKGIIMEIFGPVSCPLLRLIIGRLPNMYNALKMDLNYSS